LCTSELHLLSKVHPDFNGFGVSAIKDSEGPIVGRPYGGIGILWRRTIEQNVNICKNTDTRLLGVEVQSSHGKILLINVYMPYQCDNNYDEYMHYLGKLSALIFDADTTRIGIYGDFNANICTPFMNELEKWCQSEHMTISDLVLLGSSSGTFTYVSAAHNTTSWLDHIVCSQDLHKLVSCVTVLDKTPSSDHLAMVTEWDFSVVTGTQCNHDVSNIATIPKVFNWERASDADIGVYCSPY